jgi:type VI protein secretion system component VasF
MTQQLHDALVRIGDSAPRIGPSAEQAPDLWRRGRRARTRDRMTTVAAVLVVIVTFGGITSAVAGGPARVLPASPPGGEPGVPSTLYAVP